MTGQTKKPVTKQDGSKALDFLSRLKNISFIYFAALSQRTVFFSYFITTVLPENFST